jgi:hypothetical protein
MRLLPRRALALDGGPSVLKSGPLLLELSFHLHACTPLPMELILHLLLQSSTQLLSLLGLLLCLSLPRPRPLEGGAVLLELGLRLGQGVTSLL